MDSHEADAKAKKQWGPTGFAITVDDGRCKLVGWFDIEKGKPVILGEGEYYEDAFAWANRVR